jgi:membrane-bound ClpP family serine protease
MKLIMELYAELWWRANLVLLLLVVLGVLSLPSSFDESWAVADVVVALAIVLALFAHAFFGVFVRPTILMRSRNGGTP